MTAHKWMSMQFFGFFFTFGIFVPYWSTWLVTGKGFTADQAGLVIAMGLVTRAITTFFLFPLASKYISLARLNQIVALLSVVILILLIPANSLIVVVAITVLLSLLYPMPLAMHEAMASKLIKKNEIYYGRSRSYGSLGYIISLSLTGIIISIFGEEIIIYVMIIGSIIFAFLASLRSPLTLKEKIVTKDITLSKLFKSKSFVLVLIICVVLQSAHAAYYSYAVLFLGNIGVNTQFIGFILLIAVLSEVVFFYISDSLFKGKPVTTLLMISVTASVVRWMLIFLFDSLMIFIISQFLHSLTFGLTQVAFIKYLDENTDNKFFPYAHGLYAAFGLSLGSGILTIVSGYLFSLSPSFAFLGMALICMPCFIVGYLLKMEFKSQFDGNYQKKLNRSSG